PPFPYTTLFRSRARDLHLLAGGIDQRADAAGVRADDDRVSLAQAAVLDQRGGDRTATAVEPAFDDDSLGGAARVGLELQDLRLERGHLEQLVDAGPHLGRRRYEDRLAAPLLRDQVQ